jgi:hypothetical protein
MPGKTEKMEDCKNEVERLEVSENQFGIVAKNRRWRVLNSRYQG